MQTEAAKTRGPASRVGSLALSKVEGVATKTMTPGVVAVVVTVADDVVQVVEVAVDLLEVLGLMELLWTVLGRVVVVGAVLVEKSPL
mmetsp:Transcript_35422/g.79973  ORF Transcript_35422/g.79973 Transcript_35422/m.79973 type:complete len:87 (-) Transcript_35422:318-578(-)